jgi:uncharacterized protein Yka (UPF0111/DUF47 family)
MEKLTPEQRVDILKHLREIGRVSDVFKDALETINSFESRSEENLFFGYFQTEMLNHIHKINKIIYNK